MNPISITALLLFSILLASSQETDAEFIFHIKVAASKTAIPKTAKLYKDFPNVQAIEFPDGYIRYFIGEYETLHRAKDDLPAVQAKGYKDAYVVCIHNGEILSGDEAIMKIYEGE